MKKRTVTVTLALLLGSECGASEVLSGEVLSILAGEQYGNKIFVEVSPKPPVPANCSTNPRYSYVFDPTTPVGKVMLGLIMTAYAAGKNVYLSGYNGCDLYSGVETLKQVRVL